MSSFFPLSPLVSFPFLFIKLCPNKNQQTWFPLTFDFAGPLKKTHCMLLKDSRYANGSLVQAELHLATLHNTIFPCDLHCNAVARQVTRACGIPTCSFQRNEKLRAGQVAEKSGTRLSCTSQCSLCCYSTCDIFAMVNVARQVSRKLVV